MRTPSILVLAALASSLAAQAEYRWEQSDALGVKFLVHKKLFAVPLKLGEGDPNERAKFQPKDAGDYIHGRLGTYSWDIEVLEFSKKKEAPKTDGAGGEGKEIEIRGRPGSANFREYVTENDRSIQDRKFVKKAILVRGKKGSLDCQWWEYTDSQKVSTGVAGKPPEILIWYHCAATYDLPDREVAITATVPVKKGTEADALHMKWMETMCQSVQLLEASEAAGDVSDAKRDEFANTPERKAELEKAKANIQNLKGWNYLTTPNYIVLYAWNPEATGNEKEREAVKFARHLVSKLEEVREIFIKEFPPHDKMEQVYSVFRICGNPDEFARYSGAGTPRGVVGWFSPMSKELVVFNDTQREMQSGKDIVMTTQHEGWHQYAQCYFGGKGELHRWFDEGHGDYFGGWAKKGKTWSYGIDKGRHMSIRSQIARKDFVPVREIVTWNKDKFYTERGADYYAEGYSLIDFLRRGQSVLGKKFDERWSQVIPTYTKTMLETNDQKKAVEAAFAGVDWEKFEATWIDWVKTSMK